MTAERAMIEPQVLRPRSQVVRHDLHLKGEAIPEIYQSTFMMQLNSLPNMPLSTVPMILDSTEMTHSIHFLVRHRVRSIGGVHPGMPPTLQKPIVASILLATPRLSTDAHISKSVSIKELTVPALIYLLLLLMRHVKSLHPLLEEELPESTGSICGAVQEGLP